MLDRDQGPLRRVEAAEVGACERAVQGRIGEDRQPDPDRLGARPRSAQRRRAVLAEPDALRMKLFEFRLRFDREADIIEREGAISVPP